MAMVIDLDRRCRCLVNHRDPWLGSLGIDRDGVVFRDLWFVEETNRGSPVNWIVDGKCDLGGARIDIFALPDAIGNRIDGAIGLVN